MSMDKNIRWGKSASNWQTSSCVLRDAPENASWVGDREVAHAPRAVAWRLRAHSVLRSQLRFFRVSPPGLHVGNEQVHHEVARVLRMVEILEQKTAVAATQIGKVGIRPRNGEAKILVKLFGEREIRDWSKSPPRLVWWVTMTAVRVLGNLREAVVVLVSPPG